MKNSDNTCSKGHLTVLNIENGELSVIIDSIIDFEKRCDYYTKDLLFFVHLSPDSTVQIGSFGFELVKSKTELGCFIYREHLFIVSGKYLDKSLFSETENKEEIKYYAPMKYDPNGAIIDIAEDDSFSFWVYKYVGGKFLFETRHTFCE